MTRSRIAFLILLCALGGCAAQKPKPVTGADKVQGMGPDTKGSGSERCDATKPNREVSEYDTSGDGVPDVRKVFLAIGAGTDARMVLICRETDVNGDGKKDVVRNYDDDGRALREESDRNFDGRVDLADIYQDGKVVREESDENYDGKVDSKIFYDNGKPLRAERDIANRSTDTQWRPDRWEYYEDGKMVRMGTDLDGDGRVDRWDRDLIWKAQKDQQDAAAAAAQEAATASAAADSENTEHSDNASAPGAAKKTTTTTSKAAAKTSKK